MLLNEYNIIGIVAHPREGKTLLAVHYCYEYHKKFGMNVYSNIEINCRKEKLTIDMLYNLPEEMNNSVILIDELHMWADAYKFFSKSALAISTLFTQLGKRNIILMYTTQLGRQIPIRLRELTKYVLIPKKIKKYDEEGNLIKGLAKIEVFDNQGYVGENKLGTLLFDGRGYFNTYNTKEIVHGVA